MHRRQACFVDRYDIIDEANLAQAVYQDRAGPRLFTRWELPACRCESRPRFQPSRPPRPLAQIDPESVGESGDARPVNVHRVDQAGSKSAAWLVVSRVTPEPSAFIT